jgi:hypothetical protein
MGCFTSQVMSSALPRSQLADGEDFATGIDLTVSVVLSRHSLLATRHSEPLATRHS